MGKGTVEPREVTIERLGEDFKANLRATMPRIEQALLVDDPKEASFSATVQFGTDRNGEETAELLCRERIPIPPVKYKLGRKDGQLVML